MYNKIIFFLLFNFVHIPGQIVFPGRNQQEERESTGVEVSSVINPSRNPGIVFSEPNAPTSTGFTEEDVRNAIGVDTLESTRNRFQGSIGRCPLEFNTFGECLPYSQCPELQAIVNANGLTRPVISMLRGRVCAVAGRRFRLCCFVGFNRPSQPPFIPRQPTAPVRPQPPPSRVPPSRNNANLIPGESDCGYSTTRRIVNGEKFAHGSQPWLAGIGSINSNGKFALQCGATLITKRHVLSAAHCFVPSSAPRITHVILGEHSLSQENERVPPKVIRIRRHNNPGYNSVSHVNDVELIELEEDVVMNDFIFPACLPLEFRNDEFLGKQMLILGWGDQFFRSGQGSDVPLKAKVPVMSRNDCNQAYINNRNINIGQEQICARSDVKDACQGDSGGPFIYDGRRSYLVGIVSFGVDCQSGRFPGVYTFLPHYIDWIRNNL